MSKKPKKSKKLPHKGHSDLAAHKLDGKQLIPPMPQLLRSLLQAWIDRMLWPHSGMFSATSTITCEIRWMAT